MAFLARLHERDPSLIDKIQFHFFGQQNKFSYPILHAYPEVRRYFVLHGFIERQETLAIMNKMDILINFGNTTDYHLPSKVVDFLYLNKPLINFIANKNDTTAEFLSDYDKILDLDLTDSSHQKTEEFCQFVFKNWEEAIPAPEKLKEYLPENIGDAYLNALSKNINQLL